MALAPWVAGYDLRRPPHCRPTAVRGAPDQEDKQELPAAHPATVQAEAEVCGRLDKTLPCARAVLNCFRPQTRPLHKEKNDRVCCVENVADPVMADVPKPRTKWSVNRGSHMVPPKRDAPSIGFVENSMKSTHTSMA